MINSNFKKGFTLIELMVVITIIALLSVVVFASFNDARMQSRDKARMTSLKQLQLAVEFYKAQNGRYPEACRGAGQWSGQQGTVYACPGGSTQYIVGLAPDFIGELAVDPKQPVTNDRGILYRTNANGTAFKLLAHQTVETSFITAYGDEFARCPASTGGSYCPAAAPQPNTYAIYSAGAEGW